MISQTFVFEDIIINVQGNNQVASIIPTLADESPAEGTLAYFIQSTGTFGFTKLARYTVHIQFTTDDLTTGCLISPATNSKLNITQMNLSYAISGITSRSFSLHMPTILCGRLEGERRYRVNNRTTTWDFKSVRITKNFSQLLLRFFTGITSSTNEVRVRFSNIKVTFSN